MANLWLRKNPFMSIWLSSANRVAGSMRGQVAEATDPWRRCVRAA